MKKTSYPVLLLSFMLAFAVISFIGCQKKAEEPAQQPAQTEQPAVTPAVTDTAAPAVKDTVAAKPAVTVPDMVGTWTGTLDSRATTLKIKKQDGNTFSGSISINYREAINQEVSGKINAENMKVTMKDQLHSRYAGSYSGKLSADGKKFSGSFTQTVDNTNVSFSLSKSK